uniref:Adhesion G-protein coupled receptor G2 n=2 Tax=Scleropages formosus TaxID=113540 RepID=A0A8C9RZY5_SCLFO
MPQDHCVLFTTVAQVYQGVHLECHGTEIRLHSCMVIVKLVRPLDVCALSSVVTALLQHNTDISYDGIITRAAICGWLSEPSYDLLDSNFTWVSTDLSLSQICEENDPIILTCQEGETLSVLLNETCKDLSTPVTNGKILKFSTVNKRAQPFSSTEYITTSLPSNATQYNTTTLPSNVTQSNATSLPSNATQSNATALSSNVTRSNATSLPSNATQYNATTLPSNMTQYNTTALPSSSTQYNTTSLPSNMTQSNTTSLPSNTTQSNTTSLPSNAIQYNATTLPSNAIQYNATTLPSNMTQYNATTLPSNMTQYNTTALPSSSTQYNTTSLPSNMTQSNTTSLPSNTTQSNTTTLPSNMTQYNTTTLPSNMTQYNTTTLPSNAIQYNATTLPSNAIQYNATTLPSNTTQSNTTSLPSNTTQSNTTTLPSNMTQYNTTTLPSNAIQYNATTLPSNAIQYNATTLPSNMTQSNTTSLPSNTTQYNTTTLPSNMTQSNTTTLPSNATQYNTTALPSNVTQSNTTALPSNMTQCNTTALPSNTTQYNTTSLPSKPRLGNGTAFTLKRTQGNVIAFPSMNATDFYTTNALSNAKTNQTTMNTTAGTVASNTTSVITSTTTATNSRRLPVRPAEMPTNIASEHSTASSTPVMSLEEHAICLLNKTRELPAVNSTLMGQWVSQLEGLLSGPNISLTLGSTAISIVSNLLHANTAVLAPFSTRIIRIVDTVGLKLVLEDKMEMVSAELLALAVTRVNGFSFQETSFSISDPSSLQISVRNGPRSRGSALFLGSITLPPSLTDGLTSQEQMLASRVQFSFYQNSTVFQDRGLGNRKLNSGVLGTSVANLSISGLKEDVVITLKNREPVMGNFVTTCVFWDFGYNDGTGGWNPTGCHVQDTTYNVTVCSCNHLTSFTVLLDFSRGGITNVLQATVLAYITYIGCGISAVFLSVTLLTYLGFEKLRKDIPSKILIQLCLALLLLNLVFLLDPWLALYPSATGLCICTAFFLHYFLLVSFTWMGLEAFHMYLALVKVFNTYVSRYMLKFSLVGWGVPLVVVIIVIAINKDNYGQISYGKYRDGSTDDFCWLKNDIAFYVAVVAYFCLVFLLNMAIFVVVLVQLCRIKQQNPHDSQHRNVLQDLRSVASLTFLLGLTWGFAFFAWGPVNLAFMYLFSIFNSLQGFFIFVFHCAVKKSVRRQWRAYLCCGSLRLLENSEWSRTNRHSVITAPSIHSSNMFSASFLASDTGGIRHLEGNESPFDDSTIMFPDDQHENVSRQRMRTSE